MLRHLPSALAAILFLAVAIPARAADPAQPTPTPLPVAKAVPTPEDKRWMVVAKGEIGLFGTIRTLGQTTPTLILDVTEFTLPNGHTKALAQDKPKVVLLGSVKSIYRRKEPGKKLALTDLKTGIRVLIKGPDAGSGKNLEAREIVLL
jgi:hypothetical protein